jgi:hypothetical protein
MPQAKESPALIAVTPAGLLKRTGCGMAVGAGFVVPVPSAPKALLPQQYGPPLAMAQLKPPPFATVMVLADVVFANVHSRADRMTAILTFIESPLSSLGTARLSKENARLSTGVLA